MFANIKQSSQEKDDVVIRKESVDKDVVLGLGGKLGVSLVTVTDLELVLYMVVQLIWSMLHKLPVQHK